MTDSTYEIPGSERTLDSNGLEAFGARPDAGDVPEKFVQVTVLLRPDPAARNPETPTTRDVLRAARRPRQVDVDNVVAFANASGLTVVDPDRAPRMVVLGGTVAKIAAAFGTSVEAWNEPWPRPEQIPPQQTQSQDPRTRPFRKRPKETLKVPAALRETVQGVFGIDDRTEGRMQMHVTPRVNFIPLNPIVKAQPQHAVTELAGIYAFPEAKQKGSGQTIAILALGGRLDRDEFDQYCTSIRIDMPEVVEVPVDRGLPQLDDVPDEDAEVALDVYIIAALVPSARIAIYYAENTSQGFLNGLAQAIYNDKLPASILCITWGMHEESWTLQAMWAIDELLADAKDLGITVCCASGDMGSDDGVGDNLPHVDFPASSPNVLSCGGTTLTPDTENPRGVDESVWNAGDEEGKLYASGGGQSAVFAKPYWQRQSGDSGLKDLERRGVPDVAGFADPRNGLTITVSGETVLVGGTSAVAPVWAGLIARINENLGKPVGYLNRLLYLYVSRDAFFDIEEGDNGKWSAAQGWDACTGLGRPRGEALLQELKRLLP